MSTGNQAGSCNFWMRGAVLLGASIFSTLFLFHAGAQTTEEQKTAALQDLSVAVGQEVATEEEARAFCNQERHINTCIEIGKRYSLYAPEELEEVDTFLEDAKEEITGELARCEDEECLIEVAQRIAEKVSAARPELAERFELTPERVTQKKEIITVAREVGVTLSECRSMDPDAAPLELLRGCARLMKNQRVQEFIPEENRRSVDEIEQDLQLKEALRSGRYQCGDNTLEGCGNFCLNSTAEQRVGGAAGTPEVCLQIAQEFFGEEGVRELERAHQDIETINRQYEVKALNTSFTTDDGRKLREPRAIGRYLEEQGRAGNVEEVERGMDFMIANGLAQPEDKEFALKILRQVRETGRAIDFEVCERNPESCSDYIPEDIRDEYYAGTQAETILTNEMRAEGLSGPEACDQEENGERCITAAKRALPQLEEIAESSQAARDLIEELKFHIEASSQGFEARRRAEEVLREEGVIRIGDRAFTSFAEVDAFCRENSSICLAQAAKEGFIERDHAVQRYERVYDTRTPKPVGGFEGSEFEGQTFEGREREEILSAFESWLENPTGPPPIPQGREFIADDSGYRPQSSLDPATERCVIEEGISALALERLRRGEAPRTSATQGILSRCLGGEPTQNVSPDAGPRPDGKGFIEPELEACLRSKGVSETNITRISNGRQATTELGKNAFGSCVQEVQARRQGPLPTFEGESILAPEVRSCLQAKGVPAGEIERMDRGEEVASYLQEVARGCAPQIGDNIKPFDPLTKPFEPIISPITDPVLRRNVAYPYTFADGFTVQSEERALERCYENPPSSGAGISAECEGTFGVQYGSADPIKRDYVDWAEHTWKFFDGSTETSYILNRADQEYADYIQSVENKCLQIQRYKFRWRENAGDSSSGNWQNFGIPDCSGARVAEDACFSKYGPGWIAKDDTENCYDAYGSNFKTKDGVVYSCVNIPAGVLAPGCGKGTTEVAPRPIYGESPSDCSPSQYWDNNANTCSIYECPDRDNYNWSSLMRGCVSATDAPTICPPTYYLNNATGKCESLKCAPPQYWDAYSESCKNPEPTTSQPIYGDCRINVSNSSCNAQPGCEWYGTFCEGDNYTTGNEGGSATNMQKCFYPNATKNGAPTGYTVWCEADYLNCHEGDPSGRVIGLDGLALGAPSTCESGWSGGGGTSGNWVNHTWTFSNGSQFSSILNRTDQEYLDYIRSVDAQCSAIQKENFCWLSGAGNDSNWQEFGIPDCSGTCSSGGIYTGTGTGGGTSYPGDEYTCPSFAYGAWDNAGQRYCVLNAGATCQYNYPEYLEQANYSADNCPTGQEGAATTGGACNYNGICDGSETAQSCSSDCYVGTATTNTNTSNTGTSAGTTSGGTYTGGSSSGGWCQPNYSNSANEQSCFYPNATKNGASIGYTVWCERDYVNCRVGTDTGESVDMTNVQLGSPSSCYANSSGSGSSCTYTDESACQGDTACSWVYSSGEGGSYGDCATHTDSDSCYIQPGCSWYGTYCQGDNYSGGGYDSGSYSGGSSSCSQPLISLLGDGCHWMYSDTDGGGIYCDGPMTKSAKEGDTATTSGCTSPSGGGGNYGGDYGYCANYSDQASCTGATNCYWFNDTSGGSSYCYYSSSGGAQVPAQSDSAFATVLKAVKNIFWIFSY